MNSDPGVSSVADPSGDLPLGNVVYLRSHGGRDDHDVVRDVLDATVEMLREMPYDDLTTRRVAERARVSHADLCICFRSLDAILAEVYLGLLCETPLAIDVEQPSRERVVALFEGLVMMLADQPRLAAACSRALVSTDPSVRPIRRVQAELHRRVRTVLRSGAWPEVAQTLEFSLAGAMVRASSGSATFRAAADELSRVVTTLLPADCWPARRRHPTACRNPSSATCSRHCSGSRGDTSTWPISVRAHTMPGNLTSVRSRT